MTQTDAKTKKVHNLIIVDESGSMSVIREQAFAGMNETLQTTRQMQERHPDIEQEVTLITFDSKHTKWHYESAPAAQTHDLEWDDYSPMACTPLYDAIGLGVSKLNAHVQEGENVLATIITDGQENSSREWTLEMVHNLIEELKKQNWTFSLIGTDNLDVEAMAREFAIEEHLKFKQSKRGTYRMFEAVRDCMFCYCESVAEDSPISKGKLFENKEVSDEDPITITF